MEETARQIAALEAMRAKQAAQIFASRADTGGGMVTLRQLTSQPQLNGTIARIVASCVAPRRPSAGRMAVRLDDESIISVKFENALPEVPVGTRCAVDSGCTMSTGGGFRVDADFGSIVEVREGGFKVDVSVDATYDPSLRECKRRLVTLQPWDQHALILEADFRKLAAHVSQASGFERPFALSIAEGSSEDGCEAARAQLRAAAAAARRWVCLENQANMVKLAALNQLQVARCSISRSISRSICRSILRLDAPVRCSLSNWLHSRCMRPCRHRPSPSDSQILRRLAFAHATCPGHQPPVIECQVALRACEDADALLEHEEWFGAFPAPLTKRLYLERGYLCLIRAHMLLAYPGTSPAILQPSLPPLSPASSAAAGSGATAASHETIASSAADGSVATTAARHDTVISLLGQAEQYAGDAFADDEALRYTTFEKRVLCLVEFHTPDDAVSFTPHGHQDGRQDGHQDGHQDGGEGASAPSSRPARQVGELFLKQLEDADAALQARSQGAACDDPERAGPAVDCDPLSAACALPFPPLAFLAAPGRWQAHRANLLEARAGLRNWLARSRSDEEHADVCEPCGN